MYNKCINCVKIGASCKGPDFKEMSASELLEWCKIRKSHLRLSNAKLAELSNTPKGTIDRLFSGEHPDYKYETIRPVLRALVGGSPDGDACPEPHDEDKHLREDLQHYKETNLFLKEQLQHEQASSTGWKRIAIAAIIFSGIALLLIITALVIDALNPNIGFFWLDQ